MLTQAAAEPADGFVRLSKSGVSMSLSAAADDPTIIPDYKVWPSTRPEYWPPRDWDTPNEGRCVAGYVVTVPAGRSVTLTTILKRTE